MAAMTATQPSTLRSGYWHQTIQVSQFSVWLVGITGVALALRLFFVLWVPTQPVSDFAYYLQRAKSLASDSTYQEGDKDSIFAPLYPVLLAPFLKFSSDPVLVAKLINCLLGAASVSLLGQLSKDLFGESAGIVSALCLTIYPRSVIMPLLVASENLFIPLLVAFALTIIRVSKNQTALGVVLIGVVAGLLALTRFAGYLIGPLALIALWHGKKSIPVLIRSAIIILIAQHVVMLPWAIRNARDIGRFTFTGTGGENFYMGNNDHAYGGWYDITPDITAFDPGFPYRTGIERDKIAWKAGLEWVMKNPLGAAGLYLTKWMQMLSDERYADYFAFLANGVLDNDHPLKFNPLVPQSFDLGYWIVTALQLAGLIMLVMQARSHSNIRWPISVAAIAFFHPAFGALFNVSTRYRWPMTDLLMPFAAYAIVRVALAIRRLALARPSPPVSTPPQSP